MLKKLIPTALTLALALTGLAASAQSNTQGTSSQRSPNWCGAVAEQERYFAEHPGAREAQRTMYKQLEALAATQQNKTSYVTDVTIPVVVHIIHAGGPENISDRQINSAIDQLNIDYQKLNPDTANTVPFFRARAASLGFRFRLAKKDPNGNCTTGITRHYAPSLINDDQSGSVQSLVIWDRLRYLNIWIVSSIGTPTAGGGIVLGYSNLPQNSTAVRDGFVARGDWFGNQGTSTPGRAQSRTATHEIGHYFGLSHPWGQTNNPGTGICSGDDGVADTPTTDGTFNCDLTYSPCTDASGQRILANVQNIMDYASCPTMFTQGQKTLMRNVLATRPERTGLTTQANLVATGTDDGYVAPNCAPVVAFAPAAGSSTSVCINTPVTLSDYSYNFSSAGGALTYSWSFPGGTPATATGSTVSVSYAAAGFYPVTETVSNSTGPGTSTVTNYIRVEGPTGGEVAPYTESFENASFPALFADPTLRNYTTSGFTSAGVAAPNYRWVRQANVPAAAGTGYLIVQDRVIPVGATSQLITPNINLAAVPRPATLTFARAFALRTVASNEQLRVSFSSDCGVNWSSPTILDVTALTTQGLTPIDGYAPTNSADWQNLTVAIPAQFQGGGLFKVRFQMVNGTTAGNNFYFDNLRIAGPLGTKADALASRGISVYPSPMTNETAVHLNLTTATQVQVRLTDVLGRNVVSLPAKMYGAGQQSVALQSAGHALKAGVYVVHISLNGETFTSKLNVE
ncbi:PKD repeat protein [Hymenobacter sp. UYAg731]